MRILMPSIVDPAEARGGGWTVTRGLIKAIQLAMPNAEVDCIALPSRSRMGHRYRQLSGIAGSLLGGSLPAKAAFTRTTDFRRRIKASLRKESPDLVIINGSDLVWLLDEMPQGVPVVVVALNIEQELYARQVVRAGRSRLPLSGILAADLRKFREYEWSGMRRAQHAIFMSEEDQVTAMASCPGLDSVVVPPIFEYEANPRIATVNHPLRIGMFADFTWWPNRVSLDWFLKDVWPSVSSNVDLHLMGHGSDRAANGASGVTSHGFIHDPRDAFTRCDLMIAPIIEGAGVKVKVAEAIYNRTPIAATSFAVRGLPESARSSVRICDSAAEWIEFLGSDKATEFASRPLPEDAGEIFSLRHAACLLRKNVSGLAVAFMTE